MLPPPLSLPSSASKAALRRRALGSRAPSVAMLDDGSAQRCKMTSFRPVSFISWI